jgi:DNA polymerase-3 subunit delta'
LISGPRGVGKSNLAYVLADRLLKHRVGTAAPPAATARDAVSIYLQLAQAFDLHADLHRIRPEEGKRSIAVDQVRAMTADLALTPHIAGIKVVIIENAEAMTTEAANALLKSLEEPTANTYLFLLSERPGRLPATVRSRCQKLLLTAPGPQLTLAWLAADGLVADSQPERLLGRAPIASAMRLADEDKTNNYNTLFNNINDIYDGKADPHAIAEAWHKGDTEFALVCLAESLQATIRQRLVPGLSNPITDARRRLTDNSRQEIPTETLFAGLKMAENLREQLGRGTNVELALKALLLGLELPDQRVIT